MKTDCLLRRAGPIDVHTIRCGNRFGRVNDPGMKGNRQKSESNVPGSRLTGNTVNDLRRVGRRRGKGLFNV